MGVQHDQAEAPVDDSYDDDYQPPTEEHGEPVGVGADEDLRW